ncbi:hypothetical protein IE81DRAFT_365858 [Ceraceosorus guamensis]|uniref:HIT-type domain-containing protein n=1 Tax=Ceraceosorus guamensis TaxID=1522189 RepID=A0A316W175_9BASI|nr:hypothetical protein IE81DRAFT_365858 [Ceraceosorus guamensis]PWN43439.1 hypothetical protein IE81DRAFT_365858 [Ceraceosorus guamensis]
MVSASAAPARETKRRPSRRTAESERKEREKARAYRSDEGDVQSRRKKRRLEELERGTRSGLDTSSIVLPSNSTYTGTLAGILAGRADARNLSDEELDLDFDGRAAGSELHSRSNATGSSAAGKTSRASSTKTGKHKLSAELQALLSTRKGFETRREEASQHPSWVASTANYDTAVAPPSRYPPSRSVPPLCSVCGYWGHQRCKRCDERLCSLSCTSTHDEARCERPV